MLNKQECAQIIQKRTLKHQINMTNCHSSGISVFEVKKKKRVIYLNEGAFGSMKQTALKETI